MNILVISSILPIPEVRQTNDFVFQKYLHYKSLYKNDRVVIISPLRLQYNLLEVLRKQTPLQKLKGRYQQVIHDLPVEILPFLSMWRFRNLHSIITASIYYLNRKRIHALFKQYSFDVIHADFIFSDGMLAYLLGKRYHIPYLVNTHHEKFYFERSLSRRIAFTILNGASFVLPLNYSNYLYYRSFGINHLQHAPLGFNKRFVRQQKSADSDLIRLLTVAELIKLKNIDKVIYALERVIRTYRVHYTIIGKGPEKDRLTALARSLHLEERITFIDYIPHDQIAEEMYKHDIFIMPSYFETFGRVYFEAMAMGIPVICARNSGIFGVFKDREEGMAVDHRDIDSIVDALEHLLSDRKERLRIGRNGQELVKEFTWENIAKELHVKYLDSISGCHTR